jgi:hypothetical protein
MPVNRKLKRNYFFDAEFEANKSGYCGSSSKGWPGG